MQLRRPSELLRRRLVCPLLMDELTRSPGSEAVTQPSTCFFLQQLSREGDWISRGLSSKRRLQRWGQQVSGGTSLQLPKCLYHRRYFLLMSKEWILQLELRRATMPLREGIALLFSLTCLFSPFYRIYLSSLFCRICPSFLSYRTFPFCSSFYRFCPFSFSQSDDVFQSECSCRSQNQRRSH